MQIGGLSMGNHLAPTLTKCFMGTLKTRLFSTNTDYTFLYLCYVNDVFCIFRKKESFKNFHERLNKLYEPIVFTYKLGRKEILILNKKN